MRRRGSGGDAERTIVKEGRWRWVACDDRDGVGTGDGTKWLLPPLAIRMAS